MKKMLTTVALGLTLNFGANASQATVKEPQALVNHLHTLIAAVQNEIAPKIAKGTKLSDQENQNLSAYCNAIDKNMLSWGKPEEKEKFGTMINSGIKNDSIDMMTVTECFQHIKSK